MSTLWNKTLFYLGLVDEGEAGPPAIDSDQAAVRQVAPGRSNPGEASRQSPPAAPTGVASIPRPGSAVAGRRVEPPVGFAPRVSSNPAHAEAGLYLQPTSGARSLPQAPQRKPEPEVHIISAKNFSDAQTLADSIQAGRSVILDLRATEPEMVRRIVDFASGLTYALDGKMQKTTQGVILVTPSGVLLTELEQERLVKLGLFDATI